MTSTAYYRREADRARASAQNSKDVETIVRWLRIAKDYKALAVAMEVEETRLSSRPGMGTQQRAQPVQQQQSKAKPGDK
jgi:hypothetical protein